MAKGYVPYDGPEVTREEARAAGLTRWFKRKPCKHGHVSQRGTATGACIACNDASSLAHHKANPEKHNARLKAWKDAHREQVRAEGRAYSKANREQGQAWKTANREKLNAAEREARRRNPEAYSARSKKWAAENPEAMRAIVHTRRARMRGAEGKHTAADVRRIGDAQKWRCHWCGVPTKKGYHVDHIQPLSKGGSNWPSNLCISCGPCNVRKHATDPITFAQRMGRLL